MKIAAYNGIFNLQTEVRKHYTINIDKRSRQKKRLTKKSTFSVKWIDKSISDLRPDFLNIIKEKSFLRENSKYTTKEKEKNLRKCLFYVWLVFLRYTGYRQQCLRNCVYGKNIIFQKLNLIDINWSAEEIKNKKDIIATYDPDKHESAFGVFIECMHLYHQHIYKHFSLKYSAKINDQFFFKPDAKRECRKFNVKSSGDFRCAFVSYSKEFLKLDETQVRNLKLALSPHNLRGTHGDWLYEDLNMTIEDTATALSDKVKTVEDHYLKNNTYNVTPVLDRAAKVLDSRNLTEDLYTFQIYKRSSEKKISDLIAKDKSNKEKCKQSQTKFKNANKQIKDLRAQVKQSNGRIKSLEKQLFDLSQISSDNLTQFLSKISLLIEKEI